MALHSYHDVHNHLIKPIAIEPLANGTTALVTTLLVLPGNRTTCTRMSLATALINLRGSSLLAYSESAVKAAQAIRRNNFN